MHIKVKKNTFDEDMQCKLRHATYTEKYDN